MNCSIRKKRVFLLGLMLSFVFCGFAQKIEIKGRIVEELEETIHMVGYVNVSLMKIDSTLVTGTCSDENGNFNIKGVESGNYILSVSFLGYENTYIELKNLSKSIDLENIRLIPSSILLNEVTISASHYVNQIDRKIIFPDENQIKRSTDGVDLLRNLLLSGVNINRVDNTITGARGGTAEVRINGMKADQKEIMAINPKDIIRIEYHDEPSLRYGNNEIVLDYILHRRENGGTVFAYGRKGMPGDRTDGYAVAKANYKKSEFTLLGGVNHYNYDDNYRTNREVFRFQDVHTHTLTRTEEGLPERKKNSVSSYALSYSFLVPDKHHFNVQVGLNMFDQKNNSRSFLFTEDNIDNSVLMTDYNHNKAIQPFINFYYQLNLKNKQMLAFDIKGDYYTPENRHSYIETRQEQKLTDITTNIDGDRYWMAGEGLYEKIVDAGRLNIGIKYTHVYQNYNYSGSSIYNTKMNQSVTYFYAEWMGRINKFNYGVGIGGTQVHTAQEDYQSDDLHFTPTVRLGYQFNNSFQIRYNGRITTQSPPLGEMNEIELAIDSLQSRRGNPLLNPSTYFNNMLTVSYDKRPINANLQIVDNYYSRPVGESIFEENGKFIHMMENQKNLHQITTTAYVKTSIMNGNMNIYVRGGLNRLKSKGNTYNHTLNNWFISSGIDYTWKKWNPFWDIGTRRNSLSGETVSYAGQSTTLGLRYRLNNGLSMSTCYVHAIGWDSGRENMNQYASYTIRNHSPDSKNMFFIDFVWNFQFGRKYNSSQKKINNSDNDSGIMNISK